MVKSVINIKHRISESDVMMIESIENYQFQLVEFNHAIHIKLAYCYLASLGPKKALSKMQSTLVKFLDFKGVDANKFHVTLTHAWIKVVWWFMQESPSMQSADAFVSSNPMVLNKDALAAHYSHDLLFSDRARKKFVEPDLSPLPEC